MFGADGAGIGRHRLSHPHRIQIAAGSNRPPQDVALGKHADQPITGEHRCGADFVVAEDGCRLANCLSCVDVGARPLSAPRTELSTWVIALPPKRPRR